MCQAVQRSCNLLATLTAALRDELQWPCRSCNWPRNVAKSRRHFYFSGALPPTFCCVASSKEGMSHAFLQLVSRRCKLQERLCDSAIRLHAFSLPSVLLIESLKSTDVFFILIIYCLKEQHERKTASSHVRDFNVKYVNACALIAMPK